MKISFHTKFATGTVVVDVLTGQSIKIKHSTRITIVEGQPQIYLPYTLAVDICPTIIAPPISNAMRFFYMFNLFQPTKAMSTDNSTTSWSTGPPVNTRNILKPSMVESSTGEILQPSVASLSSKYSIFNSSSLRKQPLLRTIL